MKTTQKKLSNYNKAILSVVIVSAITGSLVMLETYRKDQAVEKFNEKLTQYSDQNEPVDVLMINDNTAIETEEVKPTAVVISHDVETPTVLAMVSDVATVTTQAETEKTIIQASQAPEALMTSVNVLFELSSATLLPEYKLSLIEMAQQIKQQSDDKVWQLIGHTDKSGHALYNLQLAKKRAQNVADFLIGQGVKEQQLTLVTLGEYEAEQLENSTYNQHLRRVQVSEYKPELTTLAVKLQARYEKVDQQRIEKEALAKVVQSTPAVEQEAQVSQSPFSISEPENKKTSIALDPTATKTPSSDNVVENATDNEPLASNHNEDTQTAAALNNYSL